MVLSTSESWFIPLQLVGGALLWALEQAFKEKWTDEVKEAWTILYGYITKEMMSQMNLD